MDKQFEILFLDEAFQFLQTLNRKYSEKILYNIRKSHVELDSQLFKKIFQYFVFRINKELTNK